MTEMAEFESLLASRFAALATPDSGDWLDVRRRARRMRLRRTALVLAATLAAVVVATPALGLHRVVVDWFGAEPANKRLQLQFLQLGVLAPAGMDPSVIPNSARKVTEVRHEGKRHVLSVAPTRRGGFCFSWTNAFGGCVRDRTPPVFEPRYPADVNPFLLGATWSPDERGVLQNFGGQLLAAETQRLVVEYADGQEAEIPVVWVSPPIDAGFYLYWVPAEHRRPGHHVSALVAEGRDGEILARQTFQLTPPSDIERPVRLPNGQLATLPERAIVDEARKLIDFRAESGQRVTLWVMPTSDGGLCYVHNRGSGCPPPGLEVHPLTAGLYGGGQPVLLGGQVRADIASYELRYEDGTVERFEPIEGFILHEIPSSHYPRGHRLELVRALDRDGTELARIDVSTGSAIYPCEKPVDIGHGVMACP